MDASLEHTQKDLSNYFTDPTHPLVRQFCRANKGALGKDIPVTGGLGGNDERHFTRVGVPVVCFGPLREECRFHGVDEFVYLSDIELVSRTLVNLIEDWNSEER